WLRFREAGIAVVILLVLMAAIVADRSFLNYENFRNILLYIPLIVVVAMGQMMVIVSRNIDLSVGSVLAFSAIVVGYLLKAHPGFPLILAAAVAVAVGAALGLVTGSLVAWLRVS